MEQKLLTFESLPINVQKAFQLLKRNSVKALQGIGRENNASHCPIAQTFRIYTRSEWRFLAEEAKTILTQNGWTKTIYNEYHDWLTPIIYSRNRASPTPEKRKLLKNFLES